MSMLLGPLSETISSVSCRACALAGDQIAGAVTAPLATTAPADFKKSRRFMEGSRCWKSGISGSESQSSCQPRHARGRRDKSLNCIQFRELAGG
jgi:hypothetical protein